MGRPEFGNSPSVRERRTRSDVIRFPMFMSCRRLRLSIRSLRVAALSATVLLLCAAAAAADLDGLARLHAVSGHEGDALAYVRSRVGGRSVVDNLGSLTARYGRGEPHTLLIAGLDGPGYVVSHIDEDGYLRLERSADPKPHYDFDEFFVGQPVRIRTHKAGLIQGVIAAPSVHFQKAGRGPSRLGIDGLYVDIGARSRDEARRAGVDHLDSLDLDSDPAALAGGNRLSAPWVSSRAGAAILLDLAEVFEQSTPRGTVTLAFVGRQYFQHHGLTRVLRRIEADRVIYFRPGGGESPGIAAAQGWSSEWVDRLITNAGEAGFELLHSRAGSPSLGPFGEGDIWPRPEHSALLSVGVENAGTPVEVVDRGRLSRMSRWLADFLGSKGTKAGKRREQQATSAAAPGTLPPELDLIQTLVETPGVSGAETDVRQTIRDLLPDWVRRRSSADEAGNLIVRLGEGEPRAVFIAHMDEIGFRVTRIRSDGTLAAVAVGGGEAALFAYHAVPVHGEKGSLPAIMTRHGTIDIGATSVEQAEEMGVAAGSTATVPKRLRVLAGGRISGRSLDDRVGCGVLARVLRSLEKVDLQSQEAGRAVWFVFSIKEESGLVGASAVAKEIQPERVYAIDSFVSSDSPIEDRRIGFAELGKGFVIRAMDNSGISPIEAVRRIADLARAKKIPVQYGVTAGGNDGSRFVSRGAVNVPLSWPLRYAHTPAEVADGGDIEALYRIVAELARMELSGRLTY